MFLSGCTPRSLFRVLFTNTSFFHTPPSNTQRPSFEDDLFNFRRMSVLPGKWRDKFFFFKVVIQRTKLQFKRPLIYCTSLCVMFHSGRNNSRLYLRDKEKGRMMRKTSLGQASSNLACCSLQSSIHPRIQTSRSLEFSPPPGFQA